MKREAKNLRSSDFRKSLLAFNHLFNSFLLFFKHSESFFSRNHFHNKVEKRRRKDTNKGSFWKKEFSFEDFLFFLKFLWIHMCHNKVNKISSWCERFRVKRESYAMTLHFPAGGEMKSKSFCNPVSKQICERFSTSVTMMSTDDKRHKIHSRNHNPWKIWYFYDLLKYWMEYMRTPPSV